jgi:hypothetical protein
MLITRKKDQYMKQLEVDNIQKITNKCGTSTEKWQTIYTKQELPEWNRIKSLWHKINQNQLIITKTDEGNTLVILHKNDNNNKIEEIITKNNFTTLPHNISNKVQQNISNNINKWNEIINTNKKWKYINMNLRAPQIHDKTKLHKHDKPIHLYLLQSKVPDTKWQNTLLNKMLMLPNVFNV